MTIDYCINNWTHLVTQTYVYNAVPRIGEQVMLSANGLINVSYRVIDVKYEVNVIKILVQ